MDAIARLLGATPSADPPSRGDEGLPGGLRMPGAGNGDADRATGLPPGLEALGSSKEALEHAQKLWQHLDELAENDPEGYKAFLEKQAKAAGVDLNSKDKPAPKAAVVVTSDLDDVRKAGATPGAEESPGSRAVVEIWVDTTGEVGPATLAGAPFDHAAPAADLSQLRVPLAPAGEPRDRQHGALGPGGRGRVLPCRAHPEIVRGAALDTAVRLALVEAAFQFWEGRGFALSRRGRKAFVDASCLPPSQRSHAESRARAAREADVRQAASSVGADLPEGLVRDLASMSVGQQKGPDQGRPLIQELAGEGEGAMSANNGGEGQGEPGVGGDEPEEHIGKGAGTSDVGDGVGGKEDGESQETAPLAKVAWCRDLFNTKGYCQVVFSLPGVSGAADVDLEVVEGKILCMDASRKGFEAVEVWLGQEVKEDAIKAKFSKKRRQLVVILPLAHPRQRR